MAKQPIAHKGLVAALIEQFRDASAALFAAGVDLHTSLEVFEDMDCSLESELSDLVDRIGNLQKPILEIWERFTRVLDLDDEVFGVRPSLTVKNGLVEVEGAREDPSAGSEE